MMSLSVCSRNLSMLSVLVIEDEFFIRLAAADTLREAGYRVYEAENAATAQNILQEHNDIEVVFSDVVMPGDIDGFGLAMWTLIHRPSVRIILTSANTKLEQFPKKDDPKIAFLPK